MKLENPRSHSRPLRNPVRRVRKPWRQCSRSRTMRRHQILSQLSVLIRILRILQPLRLSRTTRSGSQCWPPVFWWRQAAAGICMQVAPPRRLRTRRRQTPRRRHYRAHRVRSPDLQSPVRQIQPFPANRVAIPQILSYLQPITVPGHQPQANPWPRHPQGYRQRGRSKIQLQ